MENLTDTQIRTVLNPQFSPLFGLSLVDPVNEGTPISLVEQLQTTLEIDALLEIFSMEAAKNIRFCGLGFEFDHQQFQVRGSVPGKHRICFNILCQNLPLGQLSYELVDSLNKHEVRRLEKLHEKLAFPLRNAIEFFRVKQLAMKDALTGLNNRGHFDDAMTQTIARAKRSRQSFALLMLDLDNFKQVNDNYGHQTGDKVIQEFAKLLNQSIRGDDMAFRFGGDEFAIIAHGEDENTAAVLAARIQHNVSKHELLTEMGVSTSIGYSFFQQDDSFSSLYTRTDSALYAAKNFGRNCTKSA